MSSPNQPDAPKPKPTPAAGAASPPLVDRVTAILTLARRGDKRVMPHLRQLLEEQPDFANEAGDLARLVEQSWIERIAGSDLLVQESLRHKIEKLKGELSAPGDSPLEQLLAERVAVAWLAAQHAELAEAVSRSEGHLVAQLHLKRAESANRRLTSAATALAKVRRLVGGLRVEIHHHSEADAGAAGPGAAREQLREALVREAEVERELVGEI